MRLLQKHDVGYLVVGGEAVVYHGHARLTGVVDFFYDVDAANVRRLYRALEEFWEGDVPGIGSSEDLAYLRKRRELRRGKEPTRENR